MPSQRTLNAHCVHRIPLGPPVRFIASAGSSLLIGAGGAGGAGELFSHALPSGATAALGVFAAAVAVCAAPFGEPHFFAVGGGAELSQWAPPAAAPPGAAPWARRAAWGAAVGAGARLGPGAALVPIRGGALLAACGAADGTVAVYRAADGRLAATLVGHTAPVCDLAELPDGAGLLASYSSDGSIRLWDVSHDMPGGDDVAPFSFTLWDPAARRASAALRVGAPPPAYAEPAFHRLAALDGCLLACSAGSTVALWSARTGAPAGELVGHARAVAALAALAGGRRVASGSLDGTARVWDVGARQCLAVLGGHEAGVAAMAPLPDGRLAVAAAAPGAAVRVWALCEPGSDEDHEAAQAAAPLREAEEECERVRKWDEEREQAAVAAAAAAAVAAAAEAPPLEPSPAADALAVHASPPRDDAALTLEREAHARTRAELEEERLAHALTKAALAAEREARVAGAPLLQPTNIFNVQQLVYHGAPDGPAPLFLTAQQALTNKKGEEE